MAFLKTKRGNIRVISFALALALVITGCFIVNKESIDARKKITKSIKEKGEIIELNKIDDNYLEVKFLDKYGHSAFVPIEIAHKILTNFPSFKYLS